MKIIISILLAGFLFLQGCYYDNRDLLDPRNAGCDTTIVTYSSSINPIMVANCTTCHSGPNAPLGIDLSSHAGVKNQVVNGKLVGTITHSSGFIPMPKNGLQLSVCNINKIKKWVASGSPNN